MIKLTVVSAVATGVVFTAICIGMWFVDTLKANTI